MKYSESDYVNYDPFDGDRDVDIRCQTVKLVKARVDHICVFSNPPHTIFKGDMARYESALVDGRWGSYYMCIPCLDSWFDEIGL